MLPQDANYIDRDATKPEIDGRTRMTFISNGIRIIKMTLAPEFHFKFKNPIEHKTVILKEKIIGSLIFKANFISKLNFHAIDNRTIASVVLYYTRSAKL